MLDLYFLLSLPAFRLVVCWPAMLKVAGSIDGTEDYTNVAKGGEKRGGAQFHTCAVLRVGTVHTLAPGFEIAVRVGRTLGEQN